MTSGADERRWLVYQPRPTDLDDRRDDVPVGQERSIALEVLFTRISSGLVREVHADEFIGVPQSPRLVIVFHAILLLGCDAVATAISRSALVASAESRFA